MTNRTPGTGFVTEAAQTAYAAARVPEWLPNHAYLAGELATHSGILYQRNSSGTSGSSWSGTNWTSIGGGVTSVAISDVTGLQSALDALAATTGLAVVTYAGNLGAARPTATVVVWEGFPTQPTNMVDGDLWLSAAGGAFLTGTAAPTGTDGNDGDVYLRTSTWMIYGPKAGGSWPAGTSLIGANGTNGRGITSIARTSGTGAAGTTDTYTITYSDASTSTFSVTNGADGTGGGSSLTVQDEGTPLATAATTLNFTGAGVTVTGSGATKTANIPGGSTAISPRQPTGTVAATMDRWSTNMGALSLTSGTSYFVAVELKAGQVVTNVNFRTGSGGFVTVTHAWAALCDVNRVRLAVSADSTSAQGANTSFTYALGSAYTVTADGIYYIELMVAAATISITGASAIGVQQVTIPPILAATGVTGQTTPPSVSSTSAQFNVAATGFFYSWLT